VTGFIFIIEIEGSNGTKDVHHHELLRKRAIFRKDRRI